MQVYSLSEVAKETGLTRDGLLWLIKNHKVECMKTRSNRRFFTEQQLKDFKNQRHAAKGRRQRQERQTIPQQTERQKQIIAQVNKMLFSDVDKRLVYARTSLQLGEDEAAELEKEFFVKCWSNADLLQGVAQLYDTALAGGALPFQLKTEVKRVIDESITEVIDEQAKKLNAKHSN